MTRLFVVLALIAAACGGEGGASPTDAGVGPTSTTSTPVATTRVGGIQVPTAVPPVDLDQAEVNLGDIVFDTFDGGSVPLDQADDELIDGLRDAIPPLNTPVYGGPTEGAWLGPEDLVLGLELGGESYAFPVKILNFHEIVNDEIDQVPVLISYCPLCRSGVVYDRRLDGDTLTFGNTSALFENDLVMYDHQTGSYWWQVAGRAIVGPHTGASLVPLPSITTTWEAWSGLHPATLVLTRNTGFEIPYDRDPFGRYPAAVDAGAFPFPVSAAADDDRLPASALVMAVKVDGVLRAYPLQGEGTRLTIDRTSDSPVAVLLEDGVGGAYHPSVDGTPLDLTIREGVVTDESGTVWDVAGRAISGPGEGLRLEAVPSRTSFWFAIVAAFPSIVVIET